MDCKFGSTLFAHLKTEAKLKTDPDLLMSHAFKFNMGAAKKYKFNESESKSNV
jgi:hypothetical protein